MTITYTNVNEITLLYTSVNGQTSPLSFQRLVGDELKSTAAKVWATVKSIFGRGRLVVCPDFTLYVTRDSVKQYQTTIHNVSTSWRWFALTLSVS